MGDHIRLEPDTDAAVATLRLDRPKVNALNGAVVDEIDAACAQLETDDTIRAVVVWGGPRVFGGGADIEDFVDWGPEEATTFSHHLNDTFLRLERLPQVTIAAINGYALGGGLELAMATDFRIAAEGALLGLPEALLGLLPGGGGTQRLTRLVGVTKAKEIIYAGGRVTAEEALDLGLVSAVHEPERVHDEALAMARRYAAGPASIRFAKTAILDGLHLPLAEGVRVEAERFGAAFTTHDAHTGVASFLEHGPGKATFSGR